MQKGKSLYTNTEYERLALVNRINLSDGHARHTLSERQMDIVNHFPELFSQSITRGQTELEDEFIAEFFRCSSQDIADTKNNIFLTFSSSSSMKMIAQLCRLRKLKVLLIEPCFDNIRHLLLTEGVFVDAIQEEQLTDEDFLLNALNENVALWIVQPNNPTGFCLEEEKFKKTIDFIKNKKATLIVDFCFRMFANCLKTWHQYQYLYEAKISFVCIEDTGKTWPVADIKTGISICSPDNSQILHRLHDQLLLNVSPLHLLILTEFIRETINFGFHSSIRLPIEKNRVLVHSLVEKGIIMHQSPFCENVPMEFLSLSQGLPSTLFWEKLRIHGVEILPAHNYFWTETNKGYNMFRIPLSRPFNEISLAIPIIQQTVAELRGG